MRAAHEAQLAAGIDRRLIIDCSHADSGSDHRRRIAVPAAIALRLPAERSRIGGEMIESHLVEGKQAMGDPSVLRYGQSVTDACVGRDETVSMLESLARAAFFRSIAEELGDV